MNYKLYYFFLKPTSFVFLLFLNGCLAAYPTNNLQLFTYDQINRSENSVVPDVEYQIDIHDVLSGKDQTKLMSTGVSINKNTLITRISKVFSESNLFSNIEMENGTYPLHFDFLFETKEDIASLFTVIPCMLTFGIFPLIGGNDFVLTAKVYYNYNMLKKYEYSEGIKQYSGILYIGRGSSYSKVESEVIDKMLLNFLVDFHKDFILNGTIR